MFISRPDCIGVNVDRYSLLCMQVAVILHLSMILLILVLSSTLLCSVF